jgi:hypothetical protein
VPLSSAALVPALTRLDERVRATLDPREGQTAPDVVKRLYPVSTRSRGATVGQEREVVEILHGLAHTGHATVRDGLWRAAR